MPRPAQRPPWRIQRDPHPESKLASVAPSQTKVTFDFACTLVQIMMHKLKYMQVYGWFSHEYKHSIRSWPLMVLHSWSLFPHILVSAGPSLDQLTAESETWGWRLKPATARGQQSQRLGRSPIPRPRSQPGGERGSLEGRGWTRRRPRACQAVRPAVHSEWSAALSIFGCPEEVRSLECQSCLCVTLDITPSPQASWGSVSPLGRKRWTGEFLNCARLCGEARLCSCPSS